MQAWNSSTAQVLECLKRMVTIKRNQRNGELRMNQSDVVIVPRPFNDPRRGDYVWN